MFPIILSLKYSRLINSIGGVMMFHKKLALALNKLCEASNQQATEIIDYSISAEVEQLLDYLNPFHKYGNTVSGTPDFMPPEIIRQREHFDTDMVSYLYAILASERPELADLWHPVVMAYRAFEQACFDTDPERSRSSSRQTQSVNESQLTDKLELRSLYQIKAKTEQLRRAVAKLQQNLETRRVIQRFNDFYHILNNRLPLIRDQIGSWHSLRRSRKNITKRPTGAEMADLET